VTSRLDAARALLGRSPLVDGHNDLAWELREAGSQDLGTTDLARPVGFTHTDLPRLAAGRVGAQFWSVYVPVSLAGEAAVATTLEQIDFVRRVVGRYPDRLELALTAADVERIFAAGKIASLIGAEGGHSIACSLGVLRVLHGLGVRYLTLTHNANVPWADSATDAPAAGGLTAFGRQVVAEMQKYLAGGAADENRAVGSALRVPLDPSVFQKKNGETRPASRIFLSTDPAKIQGGGAIPLDKKDLGNQPLAATPSGPVLDFTDSKVPGVYLFTFTQFSGPEGENEKPSYAAYAFNIDAQREGDLKRAIKDDLTQLAPNVPIHSADDSSWVNLLKQKRDDFSTRRWLYLFILLVLIAEQAMAVRLSFHTRPEDIELHAPSAASAYSHGTAAPVAAMAPEPEPVGV